MNRKLYKLSLLGFAVVLLVVVSQLQRQLNRQRATPELGLMRVTELGSNAPPVLAFTTVALGGFRGLIANSLWIRANDLQQDGKYFEMVQLADWITKLEPTFTQVWLVLGWNMAYNISVKFSDRADRWRWVQRGIELLRDDGLRYNPKDALIYRELAWFFQHKMGANMDDAHLFYKSEWAKEMTVVLGSGRPNFEELIPPQTATAKERVRLLREKYKMDPERMQEVDKLYGPLEWRLPEAHAIYWAFVGLKESKKKDLITLRRVIYQSMQLMVMRGRLLSVEPLRFGPDLSKVQQASDAYEEMIRDDVEMRDAIKRAHRNFLKEVAYLLYTNNRVSEANRWFKKLKEAYPDAVPPNLALDEYSLERLTGNLAGAGHDKIKAIIEGLIVQHYYNLVLDEDDRALGLDLMARKLWNHYDQSMGGQARLKLAPLGEMKQTIRAQLLDPKEGLPPESIARLRTKLNLPAPTTPPDGTPTATKQ